MKTIIVPTDFSNTAKNAARYALAIAQKTGTTKIILYNAFQSGYNVVADPMVPALGALDLEAIREGSELALADFKAELKNETPDNIALETKSEFALLTEGIIELSKVENADLIVMGITGGGALSENLFGSNTINVAKNTTIPVLIVPQHASYTKFEHILFACDFNKVEESTPVGPIRKILEDTSAKLFVLHVDNYNHENAPDFRKETVKLDTLFEGFKPEYHFAEDTDFTECINEFVAAKSIDLIITIPKKHGLIDSLFKRSHTKMLAFHSHVPLLVIHD